MPFQSKAQQRYLHAHPEKIGGKSALAEWDSATNFKTLPEKKKKFAHARSSSRINQNT